jgi:hypothetical protein
MPGTGQKIVPPDFLKDSQPDTVIVMNPVYTDEIRKHLGSMGIEAELLAL